MSELRFEGRVAVITGAGRGLGRAYAELLAARGAKVVVNDPGGSIAGEGVDDGPADSVVRAIKGAGGEAVASTDSVATPQGGQAIIQAALDTYGGIDILIHNAGTMRRAPLQEMSYDDFNQVLDVHLRGGFHVLRPAFPRMCKAGYGRIVMTSSINGLYGNYNVANYNVSKSGLIGLSTSAALEGAPHGVKSNCILPTAVTRLAEGAKHVHPGNVDFSQYPTMTPDMVAPVVAWLSHERCSVSGELFVSTAGRTARAFAVESPGVFQASWCIEDVDARIDAIRNADQTLAFPILPYGQAEHLRYSFDMARKG
jgi:NAD(P)-dependent dehydrogenase (short-subunit alcohol dehydrogenase family)